MALPFSKSQVIRLGERLVKANEPSDEDLAALSDLLIAYDDTLASALEIVRDLGFDPTSRVKNTGTILEKLARHGGSWLKSMQDLAGMRIVLDGTRTAQDEAVRLIVEAFASAEREPKVMDRRSQPSQGYRAVHVIVFLDGIPVEIQVRTRWQHEWADMFEKLADLIGRGIRYGEAPAHWWEPARGLAEGETARNAALMEIYEASYRYHVAMTESAVALSDLINALEEAAVSGARQDDRVRELWDSVRESLAHLREEMTHMTPVSQRSDVGSVEP
ncbi:RelA/SpoT domain-containing protein [Streptomyces zingiberis]|uniref:RelA/SpoT domain-containing protein n=1 Tax=Streptomyces zingiberis TaxID=2053010 RepID=A0ABX1C4G8_9ACTN|nr:RelA/SpoT domain-containing protein [Streptomyces zingiberis]NJQ03558.1 RelA/SpoT domain-containing protein [Streptomyces zingiberis]